MSSTLLRRVLAPTLAVLCLLLTLAVPAAPADAMTGTITGKVMDSVTKAPIQLVDVYLGIPGAFVWARTAVDGSFTIDLTPIQYNPSTPWQVYFVKSGYVTTPTNKFFLTSSGYVFGSDPANVPNPFPLVKQLVGPRSSCSDAGTGNPNPPALTSTVYLPNVTRNLGGPDGFYTPFIIQNLGSSTASVTASFKAFDGTGPTIVIPRTIDPGRAKPIDPDSDDIALGAPGLTDNKQYAVTVSANQPVAVVVNTQADKASVANPVASATDGITTGAATVYGAYAAKNAQGVGRRSSIIVQNLGAAAVTPKITFTPLTGSPGTANTYTFPAINPNSSKPFDPRFSFSTQGTTNTPCSTGGTDCLADGEYSIKIEAVGGSIAAQVNVNSALTAMGYSATAVPATKFFLPNLTKSLCFCPTPTPSTGFSTPILLQSVTATTVTIKWYNFLGGALAYSQTVTMTPGSGVRIDPWAITQLAADKQYSAVVDAGTGTVTAIVSEFATGGDNAMIYEGFAATP